MQRLSISTLVLQIIACYIILYALYVITGPLSYLEVDAINIIMYVIVVPNYLITATILVCVVMGLPLRLSASLNNWWLKKQRIPVTGIIVGFFLASNIVSRENFDSVATYTLTQPYPILLKEYFIEISGWFICAFSALHCYPLKLLKSNAGEQSNP